MPIVALSSRLSPDCISRLQRAAQQRFEEADQLRTSCRRLGALYLYGFSVEMILTAAYFRSARFSPTMPIDRDTRQRRMAQARQLRTATGEPLMTGDPHPIVGWARFLERQRLLEGALSELERQRLREAVRKAEVVYKHWRPELRYKVTDVSPAQIDEVRKATSWFIDNQVRI